MAAREGRADVVFVKTNGSGSLDLYARELGRRLGGEQYETEGYARCAALFNAPLLAPRSLAGIGHDLALARRLRALDAPLHLPNHHFARFVLALSQPCVVTVHDTIRCRDWLEDGEEPLIHRPNRRDRLLLRAECAGLRRAARIVAVSRHTRDALVALLGIPAERIDVVHEGIDHDRFRPVEARPLPDPYVLFVGSEHPRKNLTTLLHAFARLKRDPRFARLKLVKAGAPGGPEAAFRAGTEATIERLGLGADVILAGRVDDDELVRLYAGARCLVLCSRAEGFGFTPLEAMACGCPAIVSDAGALPEVAGPGALVYGGPDAGPALVRSLSRVLLDDGFREQLRRRGLAHARTFSWERAAAETRAVHARLLAEAPAHATAPLRAEPLPQRSSSAVRASAIVARSVSRAP